VCIAKSVVNAAMKKLALVAVLTLAAPPVAAQVATSNAQGLRGKARSQRHRKPQRLALSALKKAGTLCNVITGPSNGGYGTGSVTVGSSAPPVSIPPCQEFPPANELCN
jgi:hypothetical protein